MSYINTSTIVQSNSAIKVEERCDQIKSISSMEIDSMIKALNQANNVIEESNTSDINFQKTKRNLQQERTSIDDILSQISNSSVIGSQVRKLVDAIKSSINKTDKLISKGNDLERKVYVQKDELERKSLDVKQHLSNIRSMLPTSQQEILNTFLDKYNIDFQMRKAAIEAEAVRTQDKLRSEHQKEMEYKELMHKSEIKKLTQENINIINKNKQLAQQLQKSIELLNQLNIEQINITNQLNKEIQKSKEDSISLKAMLVAAGCGAAGAAIGTILMPGIGTIVGGAIGSLSGTAGYNATKGKCVIQ